MVLLIKLVVFDLDNVIIDGEAIDEISKLKGVEKEITNITEKAMQGELDFETSIKQRVDLLKGTSVEDIKELVKKIPLTPGTEETIKELKKRGYKIAIITGSFEIISDHIKDKLDLDFAFSNVLLEEDGLLTGKVEGPLVTGSKADVLKELAEEQKISLEECVAVGDGANDISMLKAVKLGIAFNAKPALKEIADVIIEKKDLRELLPFLEVENGANVKSDIEEPKTNIKIKSVDLDQSTEQLLKEKKVYEKNLAEVAEERTEFNQEAKDFRTLRDDLNNSLKENLNKAIEFRDKRNKINEDVEKNKKLREKANKELKSMEWASGKKDRINIENEIKKIEKTIETKVLDIRKENELVKKSTELRKKLKEIQENEEVREEAMELRKLSESHHSKVVELSEEAQNAHDKMLEYFKKTDEIRSKADDAHKKFVESKEKASKKHEEFRAILNEIHKINKKIGKFKSEKREMESKANKKRNIQEKERAKEIYQKFKEGKKLSTDELLLLQKHDIV
ncbi:MAG: phosphoserine phosphatase SerB [Methanomicrobiales archaeon]